MASESKSDSTAIIESTVLVSEETSKKIDSLLADLGDKKELALHSANKILGGLEEKVKTRKLTVGSSKAIRKAMELMEQFSAAGPTWSGSEKKAVVMTALQMLAVKNPAKWTATLEVAADQINDLAKVAKGLTKINGGTTLAEVKDQLALLVASTTTVATTVGTTCGCFPKKK